MSGRDSDRQLYIPATIRLENVSKRFGAFTAIEDVSLSIKAKSIHGIIGQSGAGKSTLLRMINMLEAPDSGRVVVGEEALTGLSSAQLREARKRIGMVFQQFHLVGNMTALQNVMMALKLARYPKKERAERAIECLQFVGLAEHQHKYPAELSGGQKQRVAIARALSTEPRVLLCDEPTSSLDPKTTSEILTLLQDINERLGVTVVIVSHEMDVVKSICTDVTVMDHGKVYETVTVTPQGVSSIASGPAFFLRQLGGEEDV